MNAAAKRKFNSLVQGIGNRASNHEPDTESCSRHGLSQDSLASTSASQRPGPSLSAMASDLELFAKKRRLVAQGPSPAKYTNSQNGDSSGVTTISNISLRKWSARGGAIPASVFKDRDRPAKYCPGDREELVRRLATFQELTDWTPKPNRVSEIEWAKRGWVCTGKERVKCVLCSKERVVKLNRKEVDGKEMAVLVPSEISEALVNEYVAMIVTSHQDDCLWRKKGCDDSLLRLPVVSAKAATESLQQRYKELVERKDALPYEFNLRLPDGLLMDDIVSFLPPDFFADRRRPATDQSTAPTAAPHRTALALAVLGWQGLFNTRNAQPVLKGASCHTCLRRLGLWMFKSKEIDPATQAILVPAAMDHLDAVREHRFFCPWKNPSAQRNPGSRKTLGPGETDQAAWEVLVQSLRSEAVARWNRMPRKGLLRNMQNSQTHGRSKSELTASGSASMTPSRLRTNTGIRGHKSALLMSVVGPDGVEHANENDVASDVGFETDPTENEDVDSRKRERAVLARLRRVKSLFHIKASNKFKRLSRHEGGRRAGPGPSTCADEGGDNQGAGK